jgi:hypothetical protein
MRLRITIIALFIFLPAHLPAQTAVSTNACTSGTCVYTCTFNSGTATKCSWMPIASLIGPQGPAGVPGATGPSGPQGVPGPLIKGLTVSTDGLTLTWNGTFVTTGAGQGSITLDGFVLTCKQVSVGKAAPACQ